MSIIELPLWRIRGHSDQIALRPEVASARGHLHLVPAVPTCAPAKTYCDRCAAPIDFGAVMHGKAVYCSVECSLEGPLTPA